MVLMYIDPAFGGMLLQILIAVAAVGGAVVFSVRRKIRASLKKDSKKGSVSKAAPSDDTKEEIVDTLSDK